MDALRIFLLASLALMANVAIAKPLPTLNFKCPTNIDVHTEPGHVYINGKQAKITTSNNSDDGLFVEAVAGKIAVDVTIDATGEASASYTGPKRANGICQLENTGKQ